MEAGHCVVIAANKTALRGARSAFCIGIPVPSRIASITPGNQAALPAATMSSKAASFVKFTVQDGKTDEFVAQLKPIVKEYSQLPGVMSCTFAQTGANEIRSCVVYMTVWRPSRRTGPR